MIAVLTKTMRNVREICEEQFEDTRWGCKTLSTILAFDRTRKQLTKETALELALTSSAIAVGIMEACSKETLITCKCDTTVNNACFELPIELNCA